MNIRDTVAKIKFIVLFFASLSAGASHQRMDLQKALDRRLVKTKVVSLGGYQGFCMSIKLKNLSKDSLVIVVEPGRRLNSLEDKNQDILIVKEEVIALRAGEEKSCDIKGYCCQVTHLSPLRGALYSIHTLADSNLVRLARYLSPRDLDKNAGQDAVWALSDDHTAARITAPQDSLVQGLRELVAAIKGEELPWYRIISVKTLYANGVIGITNLRLLGTLTYSNDRENYATLSVVNEKGIPVCEIKSEWLNVCSNKKYSLDLPVKGLAKGKYTLELKTPEKQLAKREFEI